MHKIGFFLYPSLLLLRQETRERFPKKVLWLGTLLAILLELLIYFFTAKTFGKKMESGLDGFPGDYFHFILVGQILFLFPVGFLGAFVAGLQTARANGALEILLCQSRNSWATILRLGFGPLLSSLMHLSLLVFLAVSLFQFSLTLHELQWIALVLFLSIPLFTALGLLAAILYIFSGRGAGIGQYISQAGAIFAGAYFPTDVFPKWLQNLGIYISPFNAIMELGRRETPWRALETNYLFSICAWCILGLSCSLFFLPRAIERMRYRGGMEISHLE